MVESKYKLKKARSQTLDLVYSWVNNQDPKWIKKYYKYNKNIDKKRHNNYGEIYFSLETVRKFAPFFRKIYILTDNQKLDHSKIHKDILQKLIYVDHKDIIDPKFLPCFNSSVFEFYLHKIPGLSENFIYTNDDTFIGKPITKNIFFDDEGFFIAYLNKTSRDITLFSNSNIDKLDSQFLHWPRNTVNLLLKYIDDPHYSTIHNFYTLNKTSIQKSIELVGIENIEKTFSNTRQKQNLLPMVFLQLFGVYFGYQKLYPSKGNVNFDVFYFEKPGFAIKSYKKIMQKKYHFFCINEINKNTYFIYKKIINNYLQEN
jgi:hypothetical protein